MPKASRSDVGEIVEPLSSMLGWLVVLVPVSTILGAAFAAAVLSLSGDRCPDPLGILWMTGSLIATVGIHVGVGLYERDRLPGLALRTGVLLVATGIAVAVVHGNLSGAIDRGKQKHTMASMRSLAAQFERNPEQLEDPPTINDGWGQPLRLFRTGGSYRLVSFGCDCEPQADWGGKANPAGATSGYDDDIVLEGGKFVQWPERFQTMKAPIDLPERSDATAGPGAAVPVVVDFQNSTLAEFLGAFERAANVRFIHRHDIDLRQRVTVQGEFGEWTAALTSGLDSAGLQWEMPRHDRVIVTRRQEIHPHQAPPGRSSTSIR